jgi:cytoskeletal protein CcmA (bactofilin family)
MITSGNEGQGRQTLIEEDTTFRGSLETKRPIVVNGRMEGELTGPSLVVSMGGSVQGVVKVKEIRCAGDLQGEFEAEEIHFSGTVSDETVIRAKALEVKLAKPEETPIVFGECEIEVGDEPTVDEVLKRRTAALEPPKPKAPVAAAAKPIAKSPVASTAKPVAKAPVVAAAKPKGDKPIVVVEDEHKKVTVETKAKKPKTKGNNKKKGEKPN